MARPGALGTVATLRRVPPSAEPDPYLLEIREQPDALRRAADALTEQTSSLERLGEAARDRDRPFLSGMGSSFDACYPAVDHLAERGVATVHATSADLLHFRLASITDRSLLVLVSQSGGSAEVVRLAERARANTEGTPFVVTVTNGLDNELAARADVALDTRAGAETAPSSKTFAASLVQMAGVARVIAGEETATACADVAGAARRAAEAVSSVLADEDHVAETVAAVARGRRVVVVVGRGADRATAEMAALTLQECGVVADGFESASFRHGPFELAGPGLGAIVVATEPSTRPLELGLARELSATGSGVVVIGDDERADVVVPRVDRMLSPAVSIAPIQLAARLLSVEAGRPPGTYVFASKVTARE